MTAPALLAPGAVLRDRYEIRREIGRGGYSIVYQAWDRAVGSDVAVKLLVPPPATAHLARERLRREVQVVRGLSHGNIVAVYDLLDEGPWSFIVMEYVDGPDLAVRVRDRGPLPAAEAVRVGRDVAAALAAAHRRGILHRDVKPQNILLDPDGRARLTDFGSAKLDGQLGITATGALAGTLAYAAPEIVAGRRGDARADVYALGLTLHYALTGGLPGSPTGHLPTTPAEEGHHPAAVIPGVPAWLDGVVARATAAAAERRYPTAASLDEALGSAAPELGALEAPGRCALCGGADPLAVGLCPACGGGPVGVADTLVFLQRPRRRAERLAIEARLTALLPGADGPDGQAAARGERPLFRATPEGSRRILEALDRRQLPSRALPVSRSWSAVPPAYVTMVLATAIAGLAAGAAAPLLLWTTPAVGALLLLGAHQNLRRPLVASPVRRDELPADVEGPVVGTLADLPEGSARALLADVTRLARPLFARIRKEGDERGVGPLLTDLLRSACAAAADLAALDENLARFEAQRARTASHSSAWLDTLARSERARDALVQRLLEAMTVLGRLQSQAGEIAADEDASLAEVTRELRAEAEAQAAASREIAELLAV
jgi:hypothetical protein